MLDDIINSLKGISGSGNVLAEFSKLLKDQTLTVEAGDVSGPSMTSAVPVAADVWYLFAKENFLANYFTENIENRDYTTYLTDVFDFLLPGLKPMRFLENLDQLIPETIKNPFAVFSERTEWANNGVYWVNTLIFELCQHDIGVQYTSDGPRDFSPNNYVGYLSFPMGQLGVMEVISLIQETKLRGYAYDGISIHPADVIRFTEIPIPSSREMFPPDDNTGLDYCYGKHLIEKAYYVPIEATAEPAASRDVELFAKHEKTGETSESIQPKKWFRFWLHKDSKIVPGEFVGILIKPLAIPPHVWWFQESTPLLYAGNWVETSTLTSGIIISITLEEDRTSGDGDEYEVDIQGVKVIMYASDFFRYTVGDRVAIVKIDSINEWQMNSFTWKEQIAMKETDKDTIKTNYIIIPAVFYR